ncbi:MAG: hypothetical protein WCG03_04260 [Kiritimatiellales bacterium]
MRRVAAVLLIVSAMASVQTAYSRSLFCADLGSGNQTEFEKLVIQGGVIKSEKGASLIDYFYAFHFESILNLITPLTGEVRAYAAQKNQGKPFLISANLRGGQHHGRWIETAVPFDYLNNETDIPEMNTGLGEYLADRQLSETVGTGIMVMAAASANARWNRQEEPVRYGRAVALAYATGANMHIPWCLYDGSEHQRFYGRPETHAKYFQLVADHADFFNGYATLLWHAIQVPYGNEGITNMVVLRERTEHLFLAGVPTTIEFVFPNPELKKRLPPLRWSGRPTSRQSVYDDALPKAPSEGDKSYESRFYPPVLRAASGSGNAPLIAHIIAKTTDRASGREAHFTVSPELLDPQNVSKVEFVTEDEKSVSVVPFTANTSGTVVAVPPQTGDWGIFKFHTKTPVTLSYVEPEKFRAVVKAAEVPAMRMMRFNQRWQRPDWVQKYLDSMPPDPFDEFRVSRITWEYDNGAAVRKYAADKGLAYHGAIAVSESLMGTLAGMFKHDEAYNPPDWTGYALDAKGVALYRRENFTPPRYCTSFSSPALFTWLLERNKKWVDIGADGIQWDDVSNPLNQVWLLGGDYNEASLKAFIQYLKRHDTGIEATSIDEVKKLLKDAVASTSPVIFHRDIDAANADFVKVAFDAAADNRAKLWIKTLPFSNSGKPLDITVTFRLGGETGRSGGAFYLLDGSGMLTTTPIVKNSEISCYYNGKSNPSGLRSGKAGDWQTIRFHFNPVAGLYKLSTDDGKTWSGNMGFRNNLKDGTEQLSFGIYLNPKEGSFDLRRIEIETED